MAINAINIGSKAPSVGELKFGLDATEDLPVVAAAADQQLLASSPVRTLLAKLFNSFNLANHIC